MLIVDRGFSSFCPIGLLTVVIGPGSVVDTGATIYYNYLGYWDVPKNGSTLTHQAQGHPPIVSPK